MELACNVGSRLLANSLDYPQRMRIEWSQCSNSVSVGQLPRVSGKDPERIRVDSVVETFIGQLPRVSGKDPERIRVDSVIETCTCVFFVLCLWANFLIFPLSAFSFYTVQYRGVQ